MKCSNHMSIPLFSLHKKYCFDDRQSHHNSRRRGGGGVLFNASTVKKKVPDKYLSILNHHTFSGAIKQPKKYSRLFLSCAMPKLPKIFIIADHIIYTFFVGTASVFDHDQIKYILVLSIIGQPCFFRNLSRCFT